MKADTLVASLAFVVFVITNVSSFILLVRNISKLPVIFCVLLALSFSLWALHGYITHDIALMYGAGLATITSATILGFRVYYKARPGKYYRKAQ